jgi:hypothetical protein
MHTVTRDAMDPQQKERLLAAMLDDGLSESLGTLVSGFPPRLRASLPRAPTDAERLRVVLDFLARNPVSKDGFRSMETFLRAALDTCQGPEAATLLREALAPPEATRRAVAGPHDFFLCHARVDKPLVARVHAGLAGAGRTVFYDASSIEAGADFQATLDAAIRSCRVTVVFVSKTMLDSPYCMGEATIAVNRFRAGETTVVPVLVGLRAEALPPALATFQALDADGGVEALVGRLLRLG